MHRMSLFGLFALLTACGGVVVPSDPTPLPTSDPPSVTTTGSAGPQGPTGPTGPQGPQGAPGIDGSKIVQSIECHNTMTDGYLSTTMVDIHYTADVFASGAVFATSSLGNETYTVSGSALYAPSQVGAATAPVSYEFDFYGPANGGTWTVELDRTTLRVQVDYLDKDFQSADHTITWTWPKDQCVVTEYK